MNRGLPRLIWQINRPFSRKQLWGEKQEYRVDLPAVLEHNLCFQFKTKGAEGQTTLSTNTNQTGWEPET